MPRKVNLSGYIQRMLPMLLLWGVAVHEFGHLLALRFMGLDGVIKSTSLNLTWCLVGIAGWRLIFFLLAGGLTQAVYGVYNMLYESDNETWLSGFTVASQGLIYSLFEVAGVVFLGAIFSVVITGLFIVLLATENKISIE